MNPTFSSSKLFEARADAMNLGLDLNTDRNLAWGQLGGSSRSLRFERGNKTRGAGVMTGTGFRVSATPVAGVGYDGSLESLKVRDTLWVALGTKIQYSHDSVTFYDTGLARTASTPQGFVEGPDGDVLTSNITDSNVRIAVGILKAAASGATLSVGSSYVSKFVPGTLYCDGSALTYAPTFAADAGADTLTFVGHGLANGVSINVSNAGGALPAGLTVGTTYYVVSAGADNFQVSLTSGGSAVNITDVGSGTSSIVNASDGILRGISGVPGGGLAAGELVIQTSNPSTWTQKGYILLNVESKLLVMGVKDHEEAAYYSRTYTLSNPEYFYDMAGSGSGSAIMPGPVTAAIAGMQGGYIFLNKGVERFTGFDTSTGSFIHSTISRQYGAYNHKCVMDLDGQVCFMGQKRVMPITLSLSPQGAVSPLLGEDFDHPLRPWFDSHDDTNMQSAAYLKWDSSQKIIKMGASVNGALETYVHDRQAPGFLPSENRAVGTSTMFLGRSFFGHTDNGNWYEDDIGRTNDTISITHVISTGRIERDSGRSFMNAKNFRYEGLVTKNSSHILRVYVNGSSEPSFEHEYETDDYLVSKNGQPLGNRGIGASLVGGSPSGSILIFPYVLPVLLVSLSGEDFRFEWEITGDGQFFQLNTWYFSAFIQRKQPRDSQ